MRILFVCAGNVCRSVLAEHLFRKLARERRVAFDDIASAGLVTDPDDDVPDELTVRAGHGAGVEVGAHRGRRLDDEILSSFDLVAVMEEAQRRDILARSRLGADAVFILGSFAPDHPDEIADPGGGPYASYERCVEHIATSVGGLLDWLQGEKRAPR